MDNLYLRIRAIEKFIDAIGPALGVDGEVWKKLWLKAQSDAGLEAIEKALKETNIAVISNTSSIILGDKLITNHVTVEPKDK